MIFSRKPRWQSSVAFATKDCPRLEGILRFSVSAFLRETADSMTLLPRESRLRSGESAFDESLDCRRTVRCAFDIQPRTSQRGSGKQSAENARGAALTASRHQHAREQSDPNESRSRTQQLHRAGQRSLRHRPRQMREPGNAEGAQGESNAAGKACSERWANDPPRRVRASRHSGGTVHLFGCSIFDGCHARIFPRRRHKRSYVPVMSVTNR